MPLLLTGDAGLHQSSVIGVESDLVQSETAFGELEENAVAKNYRRDQSQSSTLGLTLEPEQRNIVTKRSCCQQQSVSPTIAS